MKPVHIPDATPGIADLRMENDLLAQENRILRARLAGSPQEDVAEEAVTTDHREPSPDDERFRQAFYDLRWFVQRLNGSPLGFVLRRWGGFRTLVDRYGRTNP